jgi:hypothetical protein
MTTKTKSSHALTAQAIRKELKQHFPSIKFSVKSDSFAGGDSVYVEWYNGPTYDMVSSVVSKYQYGKFDGMFDIYEHSNSRKDIPQVKYVQTQREITDDIMDMAFQDGKSIFGDWETLSDRNQSFSDRMGRYRTPAEDIWRALSKQDLSQGYNKEMLLSN